MPESSAHHLDQPLQAGDLALPNRVVMAPMTRSRATPEGVPTPIMATYYAQRASAGLIISEGVAPSAGGRGYLNIPGLYTQAQVAGWRQVTEAVHQAGGRIVAQVMHTGRIGHPELLGGATPVAPSAVLAKGQAYTAGGMKDQVMPRALETAEIAGVIEEFANATRLALEAGFDGVELHGASGYLPMQFLSSGTNLRTDGYGGSAANRARFVVEALQAMVAVAGAGRVGMKLSPEMPFNDIADADAPGTYRALLDAIGGLGLAYLHVTPYGGFDYHGMFRQGFKGAYLAGGGLTRESGAAMLAEGRADAAVYGNLFLANQDLPRRFALGAALNAPDKDTFYQGGEKGYLDYPTLAA